MAWPQKERRKLDSSSFLFRVLSQLDDYVSVWNRRHQVVFVNNRLAEFWGLRRDGIINQTLSELGIHSATADFLLAEVERTFQTGKIRRGDFAFTTLDGQQGYAEYIINPLFNDKREIDFVTCVARDVTEKKAIEKALHESEKQFRVLFEAIDQGLCVVEIVGEGEDLDLRHLYANPAYHTQSGLKAVEGIHISELFPELRNKWGETWLRVARGGVAERHRGYYAFLDRWLDTIIIPMEGPGSHHLAFLFSDITEQYNKERQLEEADRRKDEFLATLAHELRNPLAPIQSGIEVMRLALHDPSTLEDSLDMMERQMNHLVRLVDDLLDISRISRGKVVLQHEILDLREAIVKAMEATATFIADRRVHVRYPPDPLWIDADPVRIVQVVGNLLSNAGKHTESQGRIWIEAQQGRAGRIRLSVRDDGAGMSQQTQSRLFQLFMQADSMRTGGLGIGLALVRNLVELHGGTVEGHSDGLGRGSEFTLELPAAASPGELIDEADEQPAGDLVGRRILVVDDNEDAAASLALLLRLMGAEVQSVNDGETALRVCAEFAPALVLLDLGMPGMDGLEVASRLREDPEHPRLVAVTGWGQEDDRKLTREHGFEDHLVKPISRQDLQELLARLNGTAQDKQPGQGIA